MPNLIPTPTPGTGTVLVLPMTCEHISVPFRQIVYAANWNHFLDILMIITVAFLIVWFISGEKAAIEDLEELDV